jgi:predicted DNA-binding antitoxin AbrB/MazE fold protein
MIRVAIDEAQAEKFLAAHVLDGSGIGINYADALLKPLKVTLEDGRKVAIKRRGLKLTLTIGPKSGEGLMRRLAHGPDERVILRAALDEAAEAIGARITFEPGFLVLDPGPAG